MTDGPVRGRRGKDIHTQSRRPREDRGRGWSDTSTCQGTPRIPDSHREL